MSKPIVAISSLLALAAFAAGAPSAAVMKDWQDQYGRLEKLIAGDARKQAPASQMLDTQAQILETDRTPADVVLRRTEALLKHLKTLSNAPDLADLEGQLAAIKARRGQAADKDLFFEIKPITREAMLANPLVDFDAIVYCERKNLGKSNWGGDHMATVYFGHTQAYGGGLYIVRNIKSDSPEIVNVLADATITSGKWKGQRLTGGAVVSPDLSFDGKEILFAYAKPAYSGEKRPWEYTEENSLHIFKVNVDGSQLVQLTEGNYNDFDPCYLPDGRIAFISTRTTGRGTGPIYPRCFPDRAPQQHFLHSMKADGSDIIPLSYHETDEWNPSVTNDGMIVYTRWDYVDRNSNAAQHLWTCYPDGRDPRGPHGNYVHPFSTMEGSDFGPGVFTTRPCCEWHIRAVPKAAGYTGSSLFVACAGPPPRPAVRGAGAHRHQRRGRRAHEPGQANHAQQVPRVRGQRKAVLGLRRPLAAQRRLLRRKLPRRDLPAGQVRQRRTDLQDSESGAPTDRAHAASAPAHAAGHSHPDVPGRERRARRPGRDHSRDERLQFRPALFQGHETQGTADHPVLPQVHRGAV